MKKKPGIKERIDTDDYYFSNRDLKKLIIPLVIEQFLAIFVGMADSIMVARVGESAVSAVSLVDTVFVLLINIFAALATGGAVVSGQFIGKKKTEEGCKAADQLIIFTALISVVIMIITYLLRGFLLDVVFGNITAVVRRNCDIYLMIVAASIPFIALYNAGAAVYRAMGNSKVPMYMSLFMNGINIAGNGILIFGLGFGIEGAAIPTLISRVIAAVGILLLLRNQDLQLHLSKPFKITWNGKILRKIMHIGIPNGLENSLFQLGKILVLSLVAGFGTASIAANAVSNTIAMFQILPGLAVNLAMLTVAAQCVGAGAYDQVRYYTKKLLKIIYIFMVACNIIVLLVLPGILYAYNLSEEATALTEKVIIYHAICVVLIWPLSFSLPNTLRAANDVKFCMWVSILSMWIFRIGFSFVLSKTFQLGLLGVWIAMTVDWLVRAIIFVVRYLRGKWQYLEI